MFDNIEIMQTAYAMARHAGARQALVARNVANADTPGFRATDLPPFSETYQSATGIDGLRATRAGHIGAAYGPNGASQPRDAGGEAAPNGNTVSLEDEMIRSAEIRQEHDLALSIYTKARDMLRTSLGRGR